MYQGSGICKEASASFARFDAQACSFGLYDSIISRSTLIPAEFQTIEEARDALENIIADINRVSNRRGEVYRAALSSTISSKCFAQLNEIEILLHKWSLAVEKLSSLCKNDAAFQVLKAQHIAATVKTSVLSYYDELAYDAFTGKFNELLDISESIILNAMKARPTLEFSIDLGVIQPLWFTACKCRHPVLRRKAIYLLNRSGIEGLWDGCVMAAAATWVVDYEERGIADDSFIPEERRLREIGLVSLDMVSRKVSPVSSTRALDETLNYVGATVCWGEKIIVEAEYPRSVEQDSSSGFLMSLIDQWRARRLSNISFGFPCSSFLRRYARSRICIRLYFG